MRRLVLRQPNADAASTTHSTARLWEVDTLRGVAVVLMIMYHFSWDLHYFGLTTANVYSDPWQLFARGIGTMFIFLLGLSLTLSAARYAPSTATAQPAMPFWRHVLVRGSILFGLGMVITGATYLFVGEEYVRFGILHLLGLAMILAAPFVYLRPWVSLSAGLLIIGTGMYLNTLVVTFPWLIWLGVRQAGVGMVDYYPLLPWFGIALLGVATGLILYQQGIRRFALIDAALFPPIRGLRFLGRHSLAIYLVHQPVLVGMLIGLGFGAF